MLRTLLRHQRPAIDRMASRHEGTPQCVGLQNDAILTEFHTALLFSSVCSSIADVLLRGDHVRLPGAMVPYFPSYPALYTHATTSANIAARTLQFALLLQEFYLRAEFSQRISTSTLSGSTCTSTLRELEVLANSWHRVVAAGIIASQLIHALGGFSVEAMDSHHKMKRLCQAISSGVTKSVLSDGTVVVPSWAECRADVRLRVDLLVTLIFHGERHQALLRDVSRGGAGFENVPKLPVSTRVTIELADRSTFGGQVVWFQTGRMGIEFDEPLPEGHWLTLDAKTVARSSQ